MSALNHPHADLSKGQYGTVGQGLHIAKKTAALYPAECRDTSGALLPWRVWFNRG
ncbi:hypothetical protein OHC64_22885 [Escherichia coli]|nr:hypothetical protein [Escherichia coli]